MARPFSMQRLLLSCCAAAAPLCALAQTAAPPGAQAEALNMRLVGYSDLQARTAYQPTIQKQGKRWIAYIGHHGDKKLNPLTGKIEDNGTSIVDVTDPRTPRYLAHIPGEEGKAEQGGAQMVRVCAGADLPKADKSKFYMLRVFGNQAHEVWDVTDPAKPALLTVIGKGLKGTHKNFWECDTGIAYLVSGHPQWRTNRMTQIYDLSDPAKPVFIRDFGLVGQQPGAAGAVPIQLHGPIFTQDRTWVDAFVAELRQREIVIPFKAVTLVNHLAEKRLVGEILPAREVRRPLLRSGLRRAPRALLENVPRRPSG